MLYNPTTPEPIQVRYRCRNPRCAGKLETPAANPRDAFCCERCHEGYYRLRCRVCEQLFTRKTSRREVCGRSRCRHEFQRHPERFWGTRYPYKALGHNAEKSLTKSTPKTGAKSDRGWRQIAGPELSPTRFRAATLMIDAMPTSAANTVFEEYWAKQLRSAARRCRFKKRTPPVNIVGGYKFPDAPEINLDPPAPESPITKSPSTSKSSATDNLTIPEFLRRI
jgi:hypothetical protein